MDALRRRVRHAAAAAQLQVLMARSGEGPLSLPRIESEIDNHLGYINASLEGRDYLLGQALTGADIQLSFVGELTGLRTDRAIYPNLDAWSGVSRHALPTRPPSREAAPTASRRRPRDQNLRTAIHCHPVTCAPDGVLCRLLINPIP